MTLVTNETLFFTFREKELYEYLFFLFSSFVVQFSRYIRSPLSDSLLIIPQAFAFVKYFFKFFQLFSFTRLFFALFSWLSFSATFALYHKVSRLSRGFCNFFEFFSTSHCSLSSSSLSATCVVYHFCPLLSTVFSPFFEVLCFAQNFLLYQAN